jgi:hypothetical protein
LSTTANVCYEAYGVDYGVIFQSIPTTGMVDIYEFEGVQPPETNCGTPLLTIANTLKTGGITGLSSTTITDSKFDTHIQRIDPRHGKKATEEPE